MARSPLPTCSWEFQPVPEVRLGQGGWGVRAKVRSFGVAGMLPPPGVSGHQRHSLHPHIQKGQALPDGGVPKDTDGGAECLIKLMSSKMRLTCREVGPACDAVGR